MPDLYLKPFRSVRVADEVITGALDSLDEGRSAAGTEMRAKPRFSFRTPVTIVYLLDPNDETRDMGYLTPTRNISAGGLGFLHSRYVHVGTPCTVHIQRRDGVWTENDATVARCTHIHANLHEVGVSFHETIEPERFRQADEVGQLH